jgi:hypothetical protein
MVRMSRGRKDYLRTEDNRLNGLDWQATRMTSPFWVSRGLAEEELAARDLELL